MKARAPGLRALGAVVALLGGVCGAQPAGEVPLHLTCGDCPVLYRLNPRHPDVSPQGLRDREYRIPKPEGVLRIMVLGDSVTFGEGVGRAEAFPKRLEQRLRQHRERAEVLNTGVNAYTAYNEVQYYLSEGRKFQPDVVLVAFVMNDVANPRLHWRIFPDNAFVHIPDAAIPDPLDDEQRIAQAVRTPETWLAHEQRSHAINLRGEPDARGHRWPVFLTGEDSLSIHVLMDYDSPEWRWLRRQYSSLDEAVRADGAWLGILVVPLAYQLQDGYPYEPQRLFERFCRERSIVCFDPLAAFRGYKGPPLFRGNESGVEDIWHLSPEGHEFLALQLEAFLSSRLGRAAPSRPTPGTAPRAPGGA